jgi:DNA-directed RNA polymerase specialized sigma24 family protein
MGRNWIEMKRLIDDYEFFVKYTKHKKKGFKSREFYFTDAEEIVDQVFLELLKSNLVILENHRSLVINKINKRLIDLKRKYFHKLQFRNKDTDFFDLEMLENDDVNEQYDDVRRIEKEISEILGLKKNTVKSHIQRAKKILKGKLKCYQEKY